jgi:hypothetical protein
VPQVKEMKSVQILGNLEIGRKSQDFQLISHIDKQEIFEASKVTVIEVIKACGQMKQLTPM